MGKRVGDESLIDALKKSHGMVAYAAKILGIERTTIYKRMDKNPELKKSIETASEESLDMAELKLLSKINEGDLGAICFYLKCKGKKRGYVEKEKIEQNVLLAQLPGFEVKLVEPEKGRKKDAGDA